MGRWIKFEEKKPKPGKDIFLNKPYFGPWPARVHEAGYFFVFPKGHEVDPKWRASFFKDVDSWQYAPKGPKEDRGS